ncbi:hypothetical protein IMG5_109350, partial [Ichthyophthirius multifiliis]
WCKNQLDLERIIQIPNFGNISFARTNQKDLNQSSDTKSMIIYFSDNLIYEKNLKYRGEIDNSNYPPIKINYNAVHKLCQDLNKQSVKLSIDSVFNDISDLLNINNVEIDLGYLGKINCFEKTLSLEPFILNKKSQNLKSKSTVRSLLDQRKVNSHQEQSPTRRYKQYIVKIDPELLAAGTDPLSKNQDFSKLAGNASNLMKAQFTKPPNSSVRFPPILDKFSRTLASPLSSQKHNLSISNRIASNYTPSSRKLYFDYESKGIKISKLFNSAVQFTANEELLQKPATFEEELLYVVAGVRNMELNSKIQAKKTCYERYKMYIENEIPIEFVAPINNYWITDILDLIPHQLQYVDRGVMENMINQMLNEINKDYYDSVRKSILDYVLKDDTEMARIGIMEIYDPIIDYGDNYYKGLEPDQEWKDHVNHAKQEIIASLVINSKATLNLMNLWKKYEKMHFLVLPTKKDQTMTIQNFLEIQIKNITEVKNHLVSEWHKDVIDIYQEELNQMNKNKRQAILFFNSNATLMSNQIRQLVSDSLLLYKNFFQRFNKSELLAPSLIIEREKNQQNIIEDVFLHVKLIANSDKVEFADDLYEIIKNEILKIIDDIIATTQGFPRPENTIAKSVVKSLWAVPKDDEVYLRVKKEINDILDKNLRNVNEVLHIYNKYAYLLEEKSKVSVWTKQEHKREEFLSEISKYKNTYNELNKEIPFYVRTNMILVDGVDVKKQYLQICLDIVQILQASIHQYLLTKNGDIAKEITNSQDFIKAKAENYEKMKQLEVKIDNIKRVEYKKILQEFQEVKLWFNLLYGTAHKISEEDLKQLYITASLVHGMPGFVDNEENRLFKEKEELDIKLKKKKDDFENNIIELYSKIDTINTTYTKKEYDKVEACKAIEQYAFTLQEYIQEMQEINIREDLMGLQQTEFPKLQEAENNLKPYQDLWFSIRDSKVDSLKNKPILTLDPEDIEKEIKQMLMTFNKLKIMFGKQKGMQNPLDLTEEMLDELRNFQKHQVLIHVFSNKGLKQRHWEEISIIIDTQVDPNKKDMMTLQRFIAMNLDQKYAKLEEVSDSASKEFAIEKIMEKMKEDWAGIATELKPWKDTGTFIVAGTSVDEAQQILDDQIVKTMTMKGSPYAKIFEEKLLDWEDWLNYTQSLFDYFVKVQSVWLYLEPVLTSPDIAKHLPAEADEFKKVDFDWKNQIMGRVSRDPKVLEYTKDRRMLEILKESHIKLEKIQKGLNSYLEGKRSNFPRFYFLSNDELLEILSETKDPQRVQPHLKKCFEGIQKLQIDADKNIHGMYSSENEYVPFISSVNTNDARGNVDEWLLWVEERMIKCVHNVTSQAFTDYEQMERNDWVIGRCGMAVLCVNMTYWTYGTEKSLREEGKVGVQVFENTCTEGLLKIVDLVRSNISPLDRCTIEALIVLDVHNRDCISLLVSKETELVTDFQWQAQLRYYWENNDTVVRIINAVCEYNYEYLGNSARLVITPLTDRCYRTLCGAIHLNYGGAPEGPAGTGKTETVKDLAKALARQCVVFNCSDGLDYKAMGKFFKGLASSGAWSCFDEFNRIDLEVLSVVAQQILTIQLARGEGKKEFFFEDATIKLKPTCNCFITMNPGYAGRSELPDNLKALFRSVAMMVPDYAMISEICLYSYGFADARNLARKIVTTYKLCSEQLSSQDHYDYGMRAVKSVLTAAGNLKRKFATENESILMLRAISDVNLAKFLAYDIPLFKGIISDLFPGVKLPEIDYRNMYECIYATLEVMNLQKVDYFIEKIIQLYEMILVRHGLMVVGMPFSGKTSSIKVLQGALTLLSERKQMNENKVQITVINPKSITMNQLYGWADEISHEWTDGVLAVKFRAFTKADNEDRKWLIFDGPVDAVWIENMNTVLDDNKKLCLNSGEIIAMTKQMNMMFEPMDLAAASPATVSRCGMIYMEPQSMGWEPLYESWKKKLPSTFREEDFNEIDMLFHWTINISLKQLRHEYKEISPTQDQNLVVTLMRTFRGLLKDLEKPETYEKLQIKERFQLIDMRFVFAYIWSIGGSLPTSQDRKKFDLFAKRLFSKDIAVPKEVESKKISLPERGTLYDYIYKVEDKKPEGDWTLWTNLIIQEEIPAKKKPSEILVQTSDTVRYSFLLRHNISEEIPTLYCGPTGTGKSIYVKNILMNDLPRSQYMTIEVGFSAQTSANATMDIIDKKLDRKKKGVFGPKTGKCVIFVDDLNMPTKEKWGAQPPIEILRQMMDQGGWYDLQDKDKPFKELVDIIFVSAMGPPGGGRTFITARFLRHMNLITLVNFDDETLNRIFGTILHWYFGVNGFSPDVTKNENKLINATLEIYKMAMAQLLPTPMKSHYLFNLRDFAKVIMGVCMADKDSCASQEVLIRLWAHECWRVFADRLINEEDRLLMLHGLRESVKKIFGLNFDTVFETLGDKKNKDIKIETLDQMRSLIFTDVLTPLGVPKRPYEEILDKDKLFAACQESLENYNMISDKPMDLVLFSFAVEHLLIIERIVKQSGGNALLVGVGGSGRQSLTRLAAGMLDQATIQIEISKLYGKTEWHEDIKKILKNAGGKGIQTVFLFTDSQIKQEGFVEDINNLLNTCEVPNLFAADEKAELMEMVRAAAKAEGKAPEGTPDQLYGYFVERCRNYLHIVLCFSPIGDAFRNRVRMFPSLVNCCTIDWFFEWPQDALVSVAKKFLEKIEMDLETRKSCTEMVQYFHQSTIENSHKFYNHLKRKFYVTPTSYLELIVTFQTLLAEKRKEVKSSIDKYENGFNQIITTEKAVGKMQIDLTEMVPKLKKAAEDTQQKMEVVSKEKAIADVLAEGIQKEEAVVQIAVNEANAIKEDCENDLAEALPLLEQANNALNCIQKPDIDYLKQMRNPVEPIRAVMKAVCYILYPNPTEKKKEGFKTVVDWWAASVKLLGDNLINKIRDYNKDDIDEKTIQNLNTYFNDAEVKPFIEPTAVEKASPVCLNMFQWAKAMFDYYFVNKKVKPKKAALAESEEKVSKLNAQLSTKQRELKVAMDKVDNLNRDLKIAQDNKENLETRYQECSVQLERAKTLIENLGGEKGRWGELAENLKQFFITLTGDVLICSSAIAYLGPLTPTYRQQILEEWVNKCSEKNIPRSDKFSFSQVLGDPVKIRAWNIDGLPSDSFSIENAIIIFKSRRWPLCIDPQGQANKWIKKLEQPRGINIIKLTDTDYLRVLENSIQFGKPVLLENVGEDLDPSLSPILLKQTFQKGNTLYIKLGETTIEYSNDFRFYITTKYRNPHYLPELSTKVTLINFMITYEGLNDQLLGILVKKERPDLAAEKERLILEGANNKKALAEIEDKILQVLSGNKNILTDESAINILTASKVTSNEIKEKQIVAELTEKEIDEARQTYQPVSTQASCLFFTISDLGNLDPMYQYSLVYYLDLFTQGILNSEKSDDFEKRLQILKEYFLYSLYSNICRSLFEKDKLVFSILLSVRLLEFRGEENIQEFWRFLLTGGVSINEHLPEKPEHLSWLSMKNWGEINRLSDLHGFKGFYTVKQIKYISFNLFFQLFLNPIFAQQFKDIYDSSQPQEMKLPSSVKIEKMNKLGQLCILRTIRPDKIIPAAQLFIKDYLGKQFIEPPPFDLALIYKDSLSTTPLIFVLSPGSDPFASLNAFAKKVDKNIKAISLGQGQGPIAQRMISEGQKTGDWIVLQNCHLAVTWMTTLEKLCEEISPDEKVTHKEFRIWLTSYPSKDFPTAVLQAGIKMTNEPPKGLKNNIQGSYLIDPINKPEFFENCATPGPFKKLLFGLCFFHAVIQERRKYGPLGWNISYEFNESDLRICVRQLKMFLDEFGQNIPYDALKYLTAECNYGGRVTDDKDRRLINTLLEDYYCEQAVNNPNYKFAENPVYKPLVFETSNDYIEYIREKFPILASTDVFGLHTNADITKDMNETNFFTDSLLICSSASSSGGGQSLEETLNNLCNNILTDFPEIYNLDEIQEKYPVKYEESMNTVLTQELTRFNKLIKVIRSSLFDIKKALLGLILMSPQLEAASKSLFDGKVPDLWMSSSYPSLKPLGGYIADLRKRLVFFQKWIDEGAPINFWISGFYFTQSFLTGVLQNFARKYTIPIDEVQFDFVMQKESVAEKPQDGACVYGLFVEGAKWNYDTMLMDESDPKILFVECPSILLVPCHFKDISNIAHYNCPVYKTSARRGVLSTTGHSTNFVMYIRLPTDQEQKHWVKRGVALLTQLDD